jgi:hypothetical protein
MFDHMATDSKSIKFGLREKLLSSLVHTELSLLCHRAMEPGKRSIIKVFISSVRHSTEVIRNHTVQYNISILLAISIFNRMNKTTCLEVMLPFMYMFAVDCCSLVRFDFVTQRGFEYFSVK